MDTTRHGPSAKPVTHMAPPIACAIGSKLFMCVRAVGTETLDGCEDEPRIDLLQVFPAEAQPVQCAGPEVLDQHIGLRDDLPEQRLGFVALQVQRQAALVGIEREEEELVVVLRPCDVAAFRFLELDHLGAQKSEHLRAGRACLVMRHVDDTDSFEGLAHTSPSVDSPDTPLVRRCDGRASLQVIGNRLPAAAACDAIAPARKDVEAITAGRHVAVYGDPVRALAIERLTGDPYAGG